MYLYLFYMGVPIAMGKPSVWKQNKLNNNTIFYVLWFEEYTIRLFLHFFTQP
jgi:hypothetical protein